MFFYLSGDSAACTEALLGSVVPIESAFPRPNTLITLTGYMPRLLTNLIMLDILMQPPFIPLLVSLIASTIFFSS
jgi:hypothetical protein